ncbi:hypothetical protein HanRHA438_Chr14g0634071 [Helianthus annuus]|nr:hypothetical protein HanRHA438_Chr14g0634071 [Helianthus annuus]
MFHFSLIGPKMFYCCHFSHFMHFSSIFLLTKRTIRKFLDDRIVLVKRRYKMTELSLMLTKKR